MDEIEVVLIALERHERYYLHNIFVEIMKRSEGAEATCEVEGLGYVTFSPAFSPAVEAPEGEPEATPALVTAPVSPKAPRKGIVSGAQQDDDNTNQSV